MAHDVSESLRQPAGQSMSERISPLIGQSISQSQDSAGGRAAKTRKGRRVFANRVSATASSTDGSVVSDRFTVSI